MEEEDDRAQLDPAAVEDDDGFSFPAPPLLAAGAGIVPVYPVFGRPAASPHPPKAPAEEEPETATLRVPLAQLLLEEREFRARRDGRSVSARQSLDLDDDEGEEEEEKASSAGADAELDGVPPESYCLWAPGGPAPAASPPRCRKSGSTGSVLRWRSISDRLVGRSHSDGKEKFVFLHAPAALPPGPGPAPGNKQDKDEPLVGRGGGKGDAARRALRYYGRGGGGAGGSGRRRSSYLPYKQELVGLFANVSGLRRSYHPF